VDIDPGIPQKGAHPAEYARLLYVLAHKEQTTGKEVEPVAVNLHDVRLSTQDSAGQCVLPPTSDEAKLNQVRPISRSAQRLVAGGNGDAALTRYDLGVDPVQWLL
jgi:hypothetical protein